MKGGNEMKEFRREAVGNLLTVKSIVTLVLTLDIFRSGSHKPH